MGRPLTGRTRIKGKTLFAQLKGEEWKLGPVEEWNEARARRALDFEIAIIESGQPWVPPHRRKAKAERIAAKTPSEAPTVRELLEAHVEWLRAQRTRDSTLNDIEWKVQHLGSVVGDIPLDELTVDDLKTFVKVKYVEREYLAELLERHRDPELELSDEERGHLFSEDGSKTSHGRRKVGLRRGISASSINRSIGLLKTLWDAYADEHAQLLTGRNPAAAKILRQKPEAYEGTWLTPTQALYVIEASKELDRSAREQDGHVSRAAMICLAIVTGLRVSELLGLTVDQILFDQEILRMGSQAKTEKGAYRPVPLSPMALELLREHLQRNQLKSGLLFKTRAGNSIDRSRFGAQMLNRPVQMATERLDAEGLDPMPVPVTPHSLRRTYVSFALRSGVDEIRVKNRAGHKDIRTTKNLYANTEEGTWDLDHMRQIIGPLEIDGRGEQAA